jgi:glucose/arabinose dehydrogenase
VAIASFVLFQLTGWLSIKAQPQTVFTEGRPHETRPTEKKDNRPEFPEQTRAPFKETAPFKVSTLISDMPAPWSVAFLPSGKLLLTQRLPGKIVLFDPKTQLRKPVVGTATLVSAAAQNLGVLDIALDPDFSRTRTIFFTFFELIDRTNSNTCVARAVLDEQSASIRDLKVIFRALPPMPSKRLGSKTGGRIVFDREGNLLVGIGDRSDSPPWEVAQRLDSHLGKIIRISPDGHVPADNPFVNTPGALPEIWALGTRSQEGMAYEPGTGLLWTLDQGPRGGDEINIVEKGKNYGWPVAVHGIDYPGNAIGEGIVSKAGMESPVYYWDPSIAPSGLAFYVGDLFPQWKDSMFVGALRGLMLLRLQIKGGRVVAEEPLLVDRKERIRDVRIAPDGSVYVLTDSGGSAMTLTTPPTSKLLRLTPR